MLLRLLASIRTSQENRALCRMLPAMTLLQTVLCIVVRTHLNNRWHQLCAAEHARRGGLTAVKVQVHDVSETTRAWQSRKRSPQMCT